MASSRKAMQQTVVSATGSQMLKNIERYRRAACKAGMADKAMPKPTAA